MNRYKIQIISQNNITIVKKEVVGYEWVTENKIVTYDVDNIKTIYYISSFLLIINEITEKK